MQQTKTYRTCKDLVFNHLNRQLEKGVTLETISNVSKYQVESFWFDLSKEVHLCLVPVKYQTATRYLEKFIVLQKAINKIAF